MTNYRSLPIALLCLSLSACWPYLGDPYESYVDGEGTSETDSTSGGGDELFFVGEIMWVEQRGTYWGEDSTDGEVTGGTSVVYLVDGGPRSVLARWSGGDGNCEPSTFVNGHYNQAIYPGETSDIVLSGRTEITLPWFEQNNLWGISLEGGTSLGHAGGYDMNTVDTDFGSIGGIELVSTPRRLVVTNPDITGAQAPAIGRSGLRVTWENGADAVILTFITVNADNEAIESIVCGVSGDSSSFSLALDDLPSLADASYTIMDIGNVSNGEGSVADGIINDVGVIHWQRGALLP